MLDFLATFATYVHSFDPTIVEFTDKIALRWYGLSYVMGFVAAFYILRFMSRRQLWVVNEDKVGDVVTYAAIFGVFLGGRLGYVFFYMIPKHGWSYVTNDPGVIYRVWEGGMASHGGILGISLFLLFYAWKHKVSWPALGDGFSIVAPLGVFFGRVANFINGELYGTTTDAKNWYAVKFPKSLFEKENSDNLQSAIKQAQFANPEKIGPITDSLEQSPYGDYYITNEAFSQIEKVARQDPEVLKALADHTPARHPSQLYEGILEGALIFGLLFTIRILFPRLAHGIITGLFFIIYAVFRILVENVRQPDADEIMGVTKGQFYSFFMIAIGVGFLIYAFVKKDKDYTQTE